MLPLTSAQEGYKSESPANGVDADGHIFTFSNPKLEKKIVQKSILFFIILIFIKFLLTVKRPPTISDFYL